MANSAPAQIPDSLRGRLARLAARIALGHPSAAVSDAVTLACDLLVADVVTPAVAAVASLTPGETWRDAGGQVLRMFGSLGVDIPEADEGSASWLVVLRAFALWDLPLGDFYGPFLSRLPLWDEQDALDRSLVLLLDELDHATDPQAREDVVARMRSVVRHAIG